MTANKSSRQLRVCDCGCGVETHMARLTTLRGPDMTSYFVRKECRDVFDVELKARHAIREMGAKVRGLPWRERITYSSAFHDLVLLINNRRGRRLAKRAARRSWWLFVLPQWAGLKLARLWRAKAA